MKLHNCCLPGVLTVRDYIVVYDRFVKGVKNQCASKAFHTSWHLLYFHSFHKLKNIS